MLKMSLHFRYILLHRTTFFVLLATLCYIFATKTTCSKYIKWDNSMIYRNVAYCSGNMIKK